MLIFVLCPSLMPTLDSKNSSPLRYAFTTVGRDLLPANVIHLLGDTVCSTLVGDDGDDHVET